MNLPYRYAVKVRSFADDNRRSINQINESSSGEHKMTVEEWIPPDKKSLDLEMLNRFSQIDIAVPLAESLSAEDINAGVSLMRLEEKHWQVAETLNVAVIENLIRFFTLAESQLPGWEAGKNSPVIRLVKILRAKDVFSGELRTWIKKNTNNRYLPYGSAI